MTMQLLNQAVVEEYCVRGMQASTLLIVQSRYSGTKKLIHFTE